MWWVWGSAMAGMIASPHVATRTSFKQNTALRLFVETGGVLHIVPRGNRSWKPFIT